MTKIYQLTGEGRRVVKVPTQNRNEVLDYINDKKSKTATLEELLQLDKFARSEIRKLKNKRLVMEVT